MTEKPTYLLATRFRTAHRPSGVRGGGRLRARLSRALPESGFGRGVALIAGGTVIAQGLNLLLSPLITRLYDPAAFGIFGLYSSIITILLPLASLRYEMAITLPREEERAAALLRLALAILAATTTCVLAATLLGARYFSQWLHLPEFVRYSWALPVGFAAAGAYQVLGYWAVRRNAYGTLTRTKLTQGIGQGATQVALGTLASPLGLLAGDIVGRSGGVLRLFSEFRRDAMPLRATSLRAEALRYRRFAGFTAPASVLNAVAPQLPALLLVKLYGPAVGGLYALGQRLLAAPLLLIGQSIGQVFQAEGARLIRHDPKAFANLFRNTAWRLTRLGALPIIAGAFVAPWAIPFIFGARWQHAGSFVQSLAVAYVAEIIVSPLSSTAALTEKQYLELVISVFRVLLVGATFWLIGRFGLAPISAIRWYALVMVLTYSVFFVVYRYAARSFSMPIPSQPRS